MKKKEKREKRKGGNGEIREFDIEERRIKMRGKRKERQNGEKERLYQEGKREDKKR